MDPCYLQPGTLRHSVTIQSPSTTRDAFNQPGTTWTSILTTRASIESTASLTFKFSFQNSTLASNATDVITIRCPAVTIKPGMQIVFGDQVYTIQDVDDVQRRHRKLVMACVGIDTPSN
jgi:SPP1 family predicted phage head-tail adaptor